MQNRRGAVQQGLVCTEKPEEVQKWFAKSVTCDGEPYVVDLEQATAVANTNRNAIVVARAGSGKTRTIVAKIIYLVAKCGLKPDEIMTFVFNANAAAEINARLSKMRVDGKQVIKKARVATTFHAFARDIVYNIYGGAEKCGEILVDAKEEMIFDIVAGMTGGRTKDGRRMPKSEMEDLAKRMATFVERAQQKFLTGGKSLEKSAEARLRAKNATEEEREFLEQGMECYKKYHWLLLKASAEQKGRFRRYGADFNLIMSWASKLITERSGPAEKLLGKVKYILIDEYQDFSQLFLSAVMAIRKVAPEAKLFVVGDDWQAINRFAGSDVEYFQDFEKYFPEDVRRMEITTNYRCGYRIVNTARTFMRKAMAEKGNFVAFSNEPGGVMLIYAWAAWIAGLVMAHPEEDILILHRNSAPIEDLYPELKKEIKESWPWYNFDEKVRMMTMHKAKGLEASVVIILDATYGVIPRKHPDTKLYRVFGETEKAAMDDQKRLFYVAMTRAKKQLYIVHDNGHGAGFIRYIGKEIDKQTF